MWREGRGGEGRARGEVEEEAGTGCCGRLTGTEYCEGLCLKNDLSVE